MQKLIIVGNLTRDPEGRTTREGKQVCSFTVAVSRRNDREQSDFFRVSAWGKLADICNRYLAKGKKVCVTGQVSASVYAPQNGEAKANLDVFAEEVEFLSPAGEPRQTAPETPKTDAETGYVQVDKEDLPF